MCCVGTSHTYTYTHHKEIVGVFCGYVTHTHTYKYKYTYTYTHHKKEESWYVVWVRHSTLRQILLVSVCVRVCACV